MSPPGWRGVGFDALNGWAADDHAAAFAAFRLSALRAAETAPKTRAIGIDGVALAAIAKAASAAATFARRRLRRR